jgi:hypothetical protein
MNKRFKHLFVHLQLEIIFPEEIISEFRGYIEKWNHCHLVFPAEPGECNCLAQPG